MAEFRLMPFVYRFMLSLSALSFTVTGLVTEPERLGWGHLGKFTLIVSGLLIYLAVAQPSWFLRRLAAYAAGVAGAQVVGYTLISHTMELPGSLSPVVVWLTLTAYTVGLLAFGWIESTPIPTQRPE